MTNAFSGMPKKSLAHKDGCTGELMRDDAQRPVTVALLRKIAELFSKGALPENLGSYLASVLMYPFHKKLPVDKSPSKPTLCHVTVGSMLTLIAFKVMVGDRQPSHFNLYAQQSI